MARIFITGSADGLGEIAARSLINKGHKVVVHARNADRGRQAMEKLKGAEAVLAADLSDLHETTRLAHEVNAIGKFDAVIHNAGVYNISTTQKKPDGLPVLLAVNTLAPYILTCLIEPPTRLVYLSSGMHRQGDASFAGLQKDRLRINYSDSKLHMVLLAMAIARKWKNTCSNAVDPGWVPTKMGGAGAPDDLQKGAETQVWLASGEDKSADITGKYLHHKKPDRFLPAAADIEVQDKFLDLCEQICGYSINK